MLASYSAEGHTQGFVHAKRVLYHLAISLTLGEAGSHHITDKHSLPWPPEYLDFKACTPQSSTQGEDVLTQAFAHSKRRKDKSINTLKYIVDT